MKISGSRFLQNSGSSFLIVVSVLAGASIGMLVMFLSGFGNTSYKTMIPVFFLLGAFLLFLYNIEKLTDAIDHDNAIDFIREYKRYNLGVIFLITGTIFTIYIRYSIGYVYFCTLFNWIFHYNPPHPGWFVLPPMLLLINKRWICDSCWLISHTDDELKTHYNIIP